ncbi:MAG TPA: PDZ domain-containing protein [Pyrinomonadaceae bacterium]|nr:PDZ domain-containing protein [Pyrinomonadaceae bacterium]
MFRSRARLIVPLLFVLLSSAVYGQKGLKLDYTVSLSDPSTRQFHITTDIANIDQPELRLSLPTWAPGWYTVENYFKNVLRFRITDANGKVLPMRMVKKQTWSVNTKGIKQIRVDYDYRATVLALNQAKIADDYAFFTGIELFLEAEGHRNTPANVHFKVPSGWNLISALRETSDPMTYVADNYDVLVDAPAEMGKFDLLKYEVEGKPHYFVANPAGTFSHEKAVKFTEMLSKVVQADSKMFGGLPYEKYISFYFFTPPESNAGGALEHLNSFVAFAPNGDTATPEMIIGTAAHEYFHLWNVKRIRPAQMWPYDYSRENETPLLWVSEGFTNYYGVVSRYRGGLSTPESFLSSAASAAAGVEGNEVRNYVSPANASVSTWAGYDTPVAFGISYYTQGQNLGALLDLSIRNDSDGRYSLDDVMRTLYNDFYKKGRGFTTEDMISIVNKLTKKDYHPFYEKYVWGTDVPNYDEIFGYAGYRLNKSMQRVADLGFSGRFRNGGISISRLEEGSAAQAAGFQKGDIVEKINGNPISFGSMQDLAGKEATFTVKRGDAEQTIKMVVGTREVERYELASVPTPTAKQQKIRDGWLAR